MDIILLRTISLLCVAVLVALVARRFQLPYTVGLVVAGIVLAVARLQTGAMLTHEFIFDLILPPLLFDAALSLHWKELRRDLLPILALSTFGVAISALVVTGCMMYFLDWPLAPALIFSVLIAATDPVSVIAMFKDVGIKGRLRLLVESESLFNDGVAAVLFSLTLLWMQSGDQAAPAMGNVAQILGLMAGGGLFVGSICGAAALLLIGRTADHLVETTVTAVTAYGAFLIAEHFHFSGVLATVAAGLILGNLGVLSESDDNPLSSNGRMFVVAFWDFAAFIVNSLVFLLIGLAVAGIAFHSVGLMALLSTIAFVLLGRALTVYPLCLLFGRSRWAIPMKERHVLWWGGLRGALALALALALPANLDHRDDILIFAFAVVVFSVVMQGLTMPWLLRKLGFLSSTSR
ncbi:MAG TPA: sodium:proton antiporter [Burkholderiaceae bacterium]|nr:sodium:proton antiporter [Burkholderiaceae bacterium]